MWCSSGSSSRAPCEPDLSKRHGEVWMLHWTEHKGLYVYFEVGLDENVCWQSVTCKSIHCGPQMVQENLTVHVYSSFISDRIVHIYIWKFSFLTTGLYFSCFTEEIGTKQLASGHNGDFCCYFPVQRVSSLFDWLATWQDLFLWQHRRRNINYETQKYSNWQVTLCSLLLLHKNFCSHAEHMSMV